MTALRKLTPEYEQWGTLEFFVPGKVEPQGSKTRGRWSIYDDNAKTQPWKERVALVAHPLMADRPMLVDVPVSVGVQFVMYRPTTAPKKWTPPAISRPDADKCLRAVNDALTGIVFANDSQCTTHLVHKRVAEIGEETGVRIWVAVDFTCYLGNEGSSVRPEAQRDTG